LSQTLASPLKAKQTISKGDKERIDT